MGMTLWLPVYRVEVKCRRLQMLTTLITSRSIL